MIATILASSALGLLELSLENHEAAHRVLGPLVERLEEGGVREPDRRDSFRTTSRR